MDQPTIDRATPRQTTTPFASNVVQLTNALQATLDELFRLPTPIAELHRDPPQRRRPRRVPPSDPNYNNARSPTPRQPPANPRPRGFRMPRPPPRPIPVLCGNLINIVSRPPRITRCVRMSHLLPDGLYTVRKYPDDNVIGRAEITRGAAPFRLRIKAKVEIHLYAPSKAYKLDITFDKVLPPGYYRLVCEGPELSYISADITLENEWSLFPQNECRRQTPRPLGSPTYLRNRNDV